MTPKERVAIALQGGKPDRIPIVPIYDEGYVCKSTGHDIRRWNLCSADERIRMVEENFLLHREIDGCYVHAGCNDDVVKFLRIEYFEMYWRITDTRTGEQYGLLPDLSVCTPDGQPLSQQADKLEWESLIQSENDIERIIGPIPTQQQLDEEGRFGPLRYLARKYPAYHFSFQTGTPMAFAINGCGGYVSGLMLMASDPALFRKILQRCTEHTLALLAAGKQAGADSTWFTSYYTGADTISPKDYAELIFPYEREICQEARNQGLFVLNWYLGDLMPNLDKVMELPIDALVLEQGRKGYDIDPVEIRQRVGAKFSLFGFGYENDFCTFNYEGLTNELQRQISGAGMDGAFIVGTPIIPPNARPDAVDHYFREAKRLGDYTE